MQLQEGSIVTITCAKCGKEQFQVTVIPGEQKIDCSNRSGHTIVKIKKNPYSGNLSLETKGSFWS